MRKLCLIPRGIGVKHPRRHQRRLEMAQDVNTFNSIYGCDGLISTGEMVWWLIAHTKLKKNPSFEYRPTRPLARGNGDVAHTHYAVVRLIQGVVGACNHAGSVGLATCALYTPFLPIY